MNVSRILIILFASLLFSCGFSNRLNISELEIMPFSVDDNSTATYSEIAEFYYSLDRASKYVQVNDFGMTDAGHPLQEVIIDKDRKFSPEHAREENKSILFINNGIHPGEPCGVDASMLFCKSVLEDKNLFNMLENTIIVIVPIYNIGGAKNRSQYSRANQEGPYSHGFRGNAKNLDLNRDFIKNDSKNAQSLVQLFTKWKPEVFIDTHTSNGADYQHIITLIATQKDKLAPALGRYMHYEFLPKVNQKMYDAGYDMSPYVYSRGSTPDEKGIMSFPDLPRYSSGFAALHHCMSFMPETHMLKTFKDRVLSTKSLLESMYIVTHKENANILKRKREAIVEYEKMSQVPISWKLDEDISTTTTFKGYEAEKKKSAISGQERLYYNRDKTYTKEIPLFNEFERDNSVTSPEAYIIPQAYTDVIDRLMWNGVEVTQLEEDGKLEVEMYYIDDYETRKSPYEGHYLHYNAKVRKETGEIQFFAGDYKVDVNQLTKRFIIETLEPEAPDSYFSWNFFDGILMQKEYFSPYVFEDLAEEILKENPEIKKALEKKKKEDATFAESGYKQLEFIYKRSEYYEKTHNRYPVYRLM